ncbi:MAG: D-2-hydroxyacid dehydrogenase [Abditibacteriales bacterium]|nr:D-2-hydroxyacid dehydrogenase [Abditibacteriales bacterium]MDW8367017.1 D-2-hydroxyacid dehydrogenase [Abditibacteriales bacterium]
MKLLINYQPTDEHLAQIKAVADKVNVVVEPDRSQPESIADADILFGWIDPELFRHAKQLKWIQTISTGVDNILFPDLVASDVILTSTKGIVGTHLADHAFALLLAVTRGIVGAARAKAWKWQFDRTDILELDGMTMGILGMGGAGREVAKRAKAFGMHVIAVDPEDIPQPDCVDELWKPSRFYEMLGRSDVVTICAPLTPQTQGLFNREAFQRLKQGAILVNVSRGAIVDGDALTEALQSGKLHGAGLDVTWEEPLPDTHPLWQMDNVIITPHIAVLSQKRMDRVVGLFCENLRRYINGEPLMSVIDKRKGY